jgi:DNA-binding MarR family transcriptional regulator
MNDSKKAASAVENNLNLLISDISILQEKLFNQQLRLHGELSLTRAQAQVLALLAPRDGLTQTEIVEQLSIEKSALASLVTNMENNGWIARRPDSKDKRSKRVYLTNKIWQHSNTLAKVAEHSANTALKGFTGSQQHQLLHQLNTIRQQLKTALKK